MKQNGANVGEDEGQQQTKRKVQARFDEFKTWSLQEIKKRFGTIPRRYIDPAHASCKLYSCRRKTTLLIIGFDGTDYHLTKKCMLLVLNKLKSIGWTTPHNSAEH